MSGGVGGRFTGGQGVFRGSFEIRTDDKGRIIVPQKFRPHLGEQFIIVRGTGQCLFAMTENQWEASFENKFTVQKRFLDTHQMKVERFFRDGLMEASCDSQGRVALNQTLRDHAGIGLQQDVQIIGMANRLEIWSKQRWDALNSSITDSDLIDAAAELGI